LSAKSARHCHVHRILRPRFVTIGRSAPQLEQDGRKDAFDLGWASSHFLKFGISRQGLKCVIGLNWFANSDFPRSDISWRQGPKIQSIAEVRFSRQTG
jgi:hypothetical protein